MINNLIFDFGKVLVDYDFEAFFRKYIPDTERCQAFTPVLCNEELQQLLDREERPFEVIMEHFAMFPLAAVPGAIFSTWHNFSGSIAASIFRKLNKA